MANYRDDRDALRDKADVLATELKDAEAELQQKDAEIDQKDAEIARLRKLARQRPSTGHPPRNRAVLMASIAGSLAILGGIVSFTLMRSAPAPIAIPAMPLPVEARPTRAAAAKTYASFPAKVTSAVGRTDGLRVGQACEIGFAATGPTSQDTLEDVTVTCDGSAIYALSNRAGAVTSMTSWAFDTAGDADHFVFRFDDLGTRTAEARPQITLSSEQGTARIFSEGAVRMEVVLAMERVGKRVTAPRH